MKYLCVNTCFKSADILYKNEEIDFLRLDSNCKHSEHVLPAINDVLSSNNIKANNLDVFGVCIGPGSFTGIRIGVALVKGLAFSNQTKCVVFNSLELIAREYFLQSKQDEIIVIMNGLADNIFVAKYNKLGECLIEPHMVQLEEMKEIIKNNKCEIICSKEDEQVFAIKSMDITQRAYESIMEDKISREEFVLSENIMPLYLRKSQAEVELEQKQNDNN